MPPDRRRRPLTLPAAQRGELPPDGGFTREEWHQLHRGSIQASRECRERAAETTAVRLGAKDD